MATYQRMIPGGPFVEETDTGDEKLIPGGPMLNEQTTTVVSSTVPNQLMMMGAGT